MTQSDPREIVAALAQLETHLTAWRNRGRSEIVPRNVDNTVDRTSTDMRD